MSKPFLWTKCHHHPLLKTAEKSQLEYQGELEEHELHLERLHLNGCECGGGCSSNNRLHISLKGVATELKVR